MDIAGGLRNGYDTVLDTVAAARSPGDIFGIADELDNRGHGRVAADLLGRAGQFVHLRADGADVAEFIDRALARDGEPKTHGLFRRSQPGRVPVILENVARRRDPEQLMGMIAELTKRRRYGSCRRWVERGAAEYYGGSLLARLPLVLRRDHLPAVLEIAKTAFNTPKWTQPGAIPDIVQALRQADVKAKDLHALLTFTGGKRDLDYIEIAAALHKRKLHTEAEWVIEGKRHPPREPHFLDYNSPGRERNETCFKPWVPCAVCLRDHAAHGELQPL